MTNYLKLNKEKIIECLEFIAKTDNQLNNLNSFQNHSKNQQVI